MPDDHGRATTTREADTGDAGEVLVLQRAAFLAEVQRYAAPFLPPVTETCDEVVAAIRDPSCTLLVTELARPRGPRIVAAGRVQVVDGTGHVSRVVVAPDLQGQGLGGALLTALHDLEPPRLDGYRLVTGADSSGNLRLYASHGYQVEGTDVDEAGVRIAVLRRPVLRPRPAEPGARVAAYVVRHGRLLVLDHADVAGAGTQVPAGGLRPRESVAAAAVREVAEEAGIAARFVALLGYDDRPHPDTGAGRRTAYVLVEPVGAVPESWVHVVPGRDDDAGLRFACRWEPVGSVRAAGLADHQHALLASLPG